MTARRVPLYGWLAAEAVSILGTRVSMIAIPWLVLVTTGSATRTGLVAVAELTPLVIAKAVGGPLVDRLGPRRVAITVDLASAVVVGLIPFLQSLGALSFPVLLVLVGVGGALRGPGDAAVYAMIPSLTSTAEVPYERVTGFASAIERGATMLGAAIAGGLVAAVGAADAVAVDAVSFAACALVLMATTRRLTERRPVERSSFRADLGAGWRFLRGDSLLLSLCAMVAATNVLDLAYSAVLMPVWAHASGAGIGALGLVFAVWSGASMLGSVVAAAVGTRLPRFTVYVVAYLLTGVPRFTLLALGAPLWAILAMSVVSGASSGFLNPVLGAVEFERIPEPLVGRVTALITSFAWSLMPLGGLLGGLLVGVVGVSGGFWLCGVGYLVATMAPLFVPSFRGMNRSPSANNAATTASTTSTPSELSATRA